MRLALALVAGFVFVGCGGDGNTPSQFSSNSNATATPTRTQGVAGESTTLVTSSPTSATTPAANTYTVVAGDSLWAIAQQFGTTVEALAAANNIADPGAIEVGQVLTIPKPASQ